MFKMKFPVRVFHFIFSQRLTCKLKYLSNPAPPTKQSFFSQVLASCEHPQKNVFIKWKTVYCCLGGEQVPGESAEFRYRTGTCTFRDQLSGTSARLSGTRQKSIRYRTGTWIFRDLFFRYQNRYLNFQVPIYQVPELEFRFKIWTGNEIIKFYFSNISDFSETAG